MALTHGMNLTEVERIGLLLRDTYTAEVRRIEADIEQLVARTGQVWSGPDGESFRSWWPARRASLRLAAEEIEGLGSVTLANVRAQESTSAADGATGWVRPPHLTPPILGGAGAPGIHSIPERCDPGVDWERAIDNVGAGISVLGLVYEPFGRASDGLGFLGNGIDLFQAGGEFARGNTVDGALDVAFVGGDFAADRLKAKGPHGYAAGVALQTWTEVGRAATEIDWSWDGLSAVTDASLGDWGDALAHGAKETVKLFPKILGL